MTGAAVTRREAEVLLRVSFGWSNEEVGEDLGITPATVRTHVQNILIGMRAENRAHAVGIAYRTGMLSYHLDTLEGGGG